MKKKKETANRIVKFSRPKSKAKQFRHDYPVTNEVKEILLKEIYGDFTKHMLEQYFPSSDSLLEEYIDDHQISAAKRIGLFHNLFWWELLYQTNQHDDFSFVEEYITENYGSLKNMPLAMAWLREWEKAIPKFYYVGYKYNDRVFVVVDTLTKETLDVIVYDPHAVPPKKGEIVMGILIPLGDALYFPIIDFYHFEYAASKEIATHLDHYYDEYLKSSTMLEVFIHVLSSMLQIERIVYLENQKKPLPNKPS